MEANYDFNFVADAIAITDVSNFGPGTGFIFLNGLGCSGDETNLDDCPHRGVGVHNCDHYKDAGVVCPPQGSVLCKGVTVVVPRAIWMLAIFGANTSWCNNLFQFDIRNGHAHVLFHPVSKSTHFHFALDELTA